MIVGASLEVLTFPMTVSAKKGQPRKSNAERREVAEDALLRACIALISKKGVRQTTLAEVGEAAGYSSGITAHYFGTKDRLLRATTEYIHERYVQSLASKGRGHGLATIEGMIELACGAPATDAARAALIMQKEAFHGSPEINEIFKHYNHAATARIRSELEIAIKNGEVRPDIDTKLQSTILLALIRGVRMQWLLAPEQVNLSKMKTELLKFVHGSLAIQPASGSSKATRSPSKTELGTAGRRTWRK